MYTYIILFCGFVAGIVFVLLVELVAVYKWLKSKPQSEPTLKPERVPVRNPKDVADYCAIEGATDSETCIFLNLILAFLWREWRDTPKMKNYFIKKMNLEFQELLLHKAAGKLMEQISVKDYSLGESLPVIKEATVMKISSRDPEEVAQELDLALDIEYTGGFLISLDVDLIFGQTAYIAVKLNSISGRLRVQFTRYPCTHWSFSFYEDPKMDMEVESQFDGRNLSQLTAFIGNLIRRAVKKKHTLPRYKVRYKPFFVEPRPQDGRHEAYIHNSVITIGKLELEVIECSRLPELPKGAHVYCTLSVDSMPWREDMPLRRSLWPVHEVIICRTFSGAIGVSFKQSFELEDDERREIVVVETVSPQSPASQVDVNRGDILLAVNNVDVDSIRQAVRLIKNAGDKFTFKLQRPPKLTAVVDNDKPLSQDDLADLAVDKSFNFDNVIMDDDSESEEFVNIIFQEIEREVNIKKEENTRRRAKSVKTEKSSSKPTRTSGDSGNEGTPVTLSANGPVVKGRTSSMNSSDSYMDEKMKTSTPADKMDTPHSSKLRRGPGTGADVQKKSRVEKLKGKSRRSFFLKRKRSRSRSRSSSSINRSKGQREHGSDLSNTDGKVNDGDMGDKGQGSSERQEKLDISRTSENDVSSLHEASDCKMSDDAEFHDFTDGSSSDCSYGDGRDETDGEGWDNISHHNIKCETEDEKEPTGQRTSIVCANEDPEWNETFSFDVEKQHKFMNICVWSKTEERSGKDLLLGYVSIPLMEMALESLSTTSRRHEQTYVLTSSSSRAGLSRNHLRVLMPGLNPEICNGDITLSYHYRPSLADCFLTGEEVKHSVADLLTGTSSENEDKGQKSDDGGQQQDRHDFMGTQFYFPTRCDYCQKKVWTKMAFQCRVCAMVCHKKCIKNAQANTYCTSQGVRARPPTWGANGDLSPRQDMRIKKESIIENISLLPALRIPDADDLRPGIRSPEMATPIMRRRRIVTENDQIDHPLQGFSELNERRDLTDSIATAAATAREAGRELFASLDDDEERKLRLEGMVQKLQEELDAEGEKRNLLTDRFKVAVDPELRARLQTSVRKSEERGQALSLLMIQYCAALQECFELEQPQQCDV